MVALEGLDAALKAKKPVMIYFYWIDPKTGLSKWCKYAEDYCFSGNEFICETTAKFTCIKVNLSDICKIKNRKDPKYAWLKKYRVSKAPTVLLFDIRGLGQTIWKPADLGGSSHSVKPCRYTASPAGRQRTQPFHQPQALGW